MKSAETSKEREKEWKNEPITKVNLTNVLLMLYWANQPCEHAKERECRKHYLVNVILFSLALRTQFLQHVTFFVSMLTFSMRKWSAKVQSTWKKLRSTTKTNQITLWFFTLNRLIIVCSFEYLIRSNTLFCLLFASFNKQRVKKLSINLQKGTIKVKRGKSPGHHHHQQTF